jgi:glycosyltransferase involved in cell wall biosynthesis
MTATARRKLCLFTSSFGHGGTEHQFVELVTRLDREKYDLTVACLSRDGQFYGQICDAGLRVVEFPLRGASIQTVQSGSEWMRFVRREKFDLVHTFDFYTNVFAVPLTRLAGGPLVLTSRRDVGDTWSTLRRWMLLGVFHWSDHIVANSEAARASLANGESSPALRVSVVRNGVDLKLFSPNGHGTRKRHELGLSSDALVVGTISNLRTEKGHRTLVEAIPEIIQKIPQARFLIIGTGPLEEELKLLVQEKGLATYVAFLGRRADTAELLGAMDLMVLPSLSESLPNVVLEAMSAGCPVIATDVGGCGELIQHGVNGVLLPPGQPSALSAAVIRLLQDPRLRLQFGRAARARAEKDFDINLSVKRLEDVYERMLAMRHEPN